MRLPLLAILGLGSLLTAQTTHIVSATPGPDVDFADLPAAIAAALPGDTILMRPGVYSPATIDVGVTIQGEPGVTFADGTFFVRDLPADQTLVLRDLDLSGTANSFQEEIRLNIGPDNGHVHLESIRIDLAGDAFYFSGKAAVLLASSPLARTTLSMLGCDIQGGTALRMGLNTTAHLTDCRMVGTTHARGLPGANAAIDMGLGSTLTVNGGVYVGGDARTIDGVLYPASSAIQANGQLRVGGIGTRIAGLGAPAIEVGNNTIPGRTPTIVVDPGVALESPMGFPTTVGPVQIRRLPSVQWVPSPNPNRVAVELSGPPQTPWVLVANDLFGPLVTELGILWTNPIQVTVVKMGMFNAHGRSSAFLPVPPPGPGIPLASGAAPVISLQALVFRADGAGLGLPTILQYP